MNSQYKKSPSFAQLKQSKKLIEDWFFPEKKSICGIDEVGRGCLAGPLVVAAVILPSDKRKIPIGLLKDSKKISAHARMKAYNWLIRESSYSISVVHPRIIDQHNIWQATLLGMQKAATDLLLRAPLPAAIVVDAMPLQLSSPIYKHIPIHAFTKGEDRSLSIAGASIVAKVYRDMLLKKLDKHFPGYSLHEHKGYATAEHQKSLLSENRCLLHRTTFLKNFYAKKEELSENRLQQSIC